MGVLVLKNKNGDTVEIDEAEATRLFTRLTAMSNLTSVAGAAGAQNDSEAIIEVSSDDEDARIAPIAGGGGGGAGNGGNSQGSNSGSPIRLDSLIYSRATLEALKLYTGFAHRTVSIPKPLVSELSQCVTPEEMQLVTAAEQEDYLVELLDLASLLLCEPLTALCAAYMSERINEIARTAPDIMTGAASIRQFLHMENEWTGEEMECLKKEMEYAKMVDPNVY